MGMSGYVRVSRVGGREGDSYGSPDEQQKSIQGWAASHNCSVDGIVVEEDVSGAKRAADRELGRLIADVEQGKSTGIVTYRLSRFGRTLLETLQNVERLKAAGGRLVCVADGIDTDTPTGKILIGILGTLAEVELDQRKEYWDTSVRRAVERGVFVGPAPLGYVKGQDGRLAIAPKAAAVVKDAFAARARGASWGQLAELFRAAGFDVSKSGARSIIGSRTYRGEIVKGSHFNPGAHDPIVDETTWQTAQLSNGAVRTGRLAEAGYLAGLVVCGSCNHRMSVSGGDHLSYVCKGASVCPARAYVSVAKLDGYMEPMIVERLEQGVDLKKVQAEQSVAIKELSDAHAELEAFVKHASVADLGEMYGPEVARRREALREAQARVDETMNVPGAVTLTDWNLMSDVARREVVAPLLNAVIVARSNRGRWQPLEERVTPLWK